MSTMDYCPPTINENTRSFLFSKKKQDMKRTENNIVETTFASMSLTEQAMASLLGMV